MTDNDRVPQVLVVDDEPNIRELVQVALKFHGCSVTTAANGRDALRQAGPQVNAGARLDPGDEAVATQVLQRMAVGNAQRPHPQRQGKQRQIELDLEPDAGIG